MKIIGAHIFDYDATFRGTLTGNITGNVSGTAATVTGAAQTNITSVGTLTAVTVSGNINANGNIVGDDSTNITNIQSINADNLYFDGDGATGIEMAANDVSIVDASGNKITTFANDTLTVGADSTIKIIFNNLPTSDPEVTNVLWNNNGVLNISVGG